MVWKARAFGLFPDSRLIASTVFTDGTVRIWDFVTHRCLWIIKEERELFCPHSVRFTPDGKLP
jgi:hypothetical protein